MKPRQAELRTVRATRYVTPLREGGSLPAIVEGEDSGLYVLKFRGAGQGRKALIAELLAGQVGRALGLSVPEIVLMELDATLGRNEPDSEIRDLIKASPGLNLALDFLPGSLRYDRLAGDPVDGALASAVVWFDALVLNVDRTPRNPNLLVWHKKLWLIDHGAALYFHHDWTRADERARDPLPQVKDHVLLPLADGLAQAAARLRPMLDSAAIAEVVSALPETWLEGEPGFASAEAVRAAYREWLERRCDSSPQFLDEAIRARAQLV